MSKEIIYKDLELSDRFDVAFPDKRVPSGYIHKTKTRVGITFTNFHDRRNGLTVLPSEAIIEDSLKDYPYLDLFAVRAKVTVNEIADYLNSDRPIKRLVSTPESFYKIMRASTMISINIYKDYFLYMDEVHCYASEGFRDDILGPFDFDHVWKFHQYGNLAMGSATPFPFSDPRVAALQHYKLRYREKFGTIKIIHDSSPLITLQSILTCPDTYPATFTYS